MMHLTPPTVQKLDNTILLLKINSFLIDKLNSRSLSGHTLSVRVFNNTLKEDSGIIILMFPENYDSLRYLTSLSCKVKIDEDKKTKTVASSS